MRTPSRRWRPVAIGALLVAAGCGWALLPAFRWGGVAPARSVRALPALGGMLTVPKGGTILCQGDSLTYGAERWGGALPPINGGESWRVATPFPETLATLLGGKVAVRNHGYPGDTVVSGSTRWAGTGPVDLVVVMYGSNDANPRGWRTAVPMDQYRAALRGIIRRYRAGGAQVLVLAPPPAGTRHAEAAIAPYRQAARAVAMREGVAFADPAAFLAGLRVPLQWDGLHLRGAATARIAQGIARRIQVL